MKENIHDPIAHPKPQAGQADIYPEAHLVNPTTLLALHRLSEHLGRRKHKHRGAKAAKNQPKV